MFGRFDLSYKRTYKQSRELSWPPPAELDFERERLFK
jgi:hypothetical protein